MDITRNDYNIKTSVVSPAGLKALANKTGINLMIFIFIFMENCLSYIAMRDISVWLRTGCYKADINQFEVILIEIGLDRMTNLNYSAHLRKYSNAGIHIGNMQKNNTFISYT